MPQHRYGSDATWFHVVVWKMNYTNEEPADMHLVLGEVRGNSAKADLLHAEMLISSLRVYLFTYIRIR
jgi:hypothetical protein